MEIIYNKQTKNKVSLTPKFLSNLEITINNGFENFREKYNESLSKEMIRTNYDSLRDYLLQTLGLRGDLNSTELDDLDKSIIKFIKNYDRLIN